MLKQTNKQKQTEHAYYRKMFDSAAVGKRVAMLGITGVRGIISLRLSTNL